MSEKSKKGASILWLLKAMKANFYKNEVFSCKCIVLTYLTIYIDTSNPYLLILLCDMSNRCVVAELEGWMLGMVQCGFLCILSSRHTRTILFRRPCSSASGIQSWFTLIHKIGRAGSIPVPPLFWLFSQGFFFLSRPKRPIRALIGIKHFANNYF